MKTTSPSARPRPVVTARELRAFSPFDGCDEAELEAFVQRATPRAFADGARIVAQGAHGSGCYLLVSGEVQIVKTTGVGHWIVGALKAGSVFGQIALVDNLPRTASVIAMGDVVVLHVGRAAFDELLASTSEVAFRLREQIAISGIRQLRHVTRRLASLLDEKRSPRNGTDPRRELVYVQTAAQEWELPVGEEDAG